jgi:hypothetical protein
LEVFDDVVVSSFLDSVEANDWKHCPHHTRMSGVDSDSSSSSEEDLPDWSDDEHASASDEEQEGELMRRNR